MADMKKVYKGLIIVNLFFIIFRAMGQENWAGAQPKRPQWYRDVNVFGTQIQDC